MITEDYILRIIRLAAEFIAKALKLSKEGDFLTSEKTLENGLQDLTGISLDTLVRLDIEALRLIVNDDEPSLYVLAQFMETYAEVERQKGLLDNHFIYLKKSLELYLCISRTEEYGTEEPIKRIYPKVKAVLYEKSLIKKLIGFFGDEDHEQTVYLNQLLQ